MSCTETKSPAAMSRGKGLEAVLGKNSPKNATPRPVLQVPRKIGAIIAAALANSRLSFRRSRR